MLYNMLINIVNNNIYASYNTVLLCVEGVQFEMHFGNKLYDNIYKRDMGGHEVGHFYQRGNSDIADFNMCDNVTLCN